jgi:hypothetical protein
MFQNTEVTQCFLTKMKLRWKSVATLATTFYRKIQRAASKQPMTQRQNDKGNYK